MKFKRDFFFLPSQHGDIFSVYYHPYGSHFSHQTLLYIHPFADEMNKSRRMVSLQAQDICQAGFGVLQIDLYGCGDSAGEFCDATWDIWKSNIQTAVEWIFDTLKSQVILWGLRLGALLMMDWAKGTSVPVSKYVFWQPVLNGDLSMRQFFRIAHMSNVIGKNPEAENQRKIHANGGEIVEIAGYELNSKLVHDVKKTKLENLIPSPESLVIWNETSLYEPLEFSPASQKHIELFRQNGCIVNNIVVKGDSFWNTVEITTAPELIKATTESIKAGQS